MADSTVEITVRQSERGWDVIEKFSSGGVSPTTSYPNAAKAAARVLQLMELTQPVAPQDWPERVCIGFVEKVAADVDAELSGFVDVPRAPTAQEDRWLHNAVKASSTVVAPGKAADVAACYVCDGSGKVDGALCHNTGCPARAAAGVKGTPK